KRCKSKVSLASSFTRRTRCSRLGTHGRSRPCRRSAAALAAATLPHRASCHMPLRLAAAKAAALRQSSLEEGELGGRWRRRQRDVTAVGDAVFSAEVADAG